MYCVAPPQRTVVLKLNAEVGFPGLFLPWSEMKCMVGNNAEPLQSPLLGKAALDIGGVLSRTWDHHF